MDKPGHDEQRVMTSCNAVEIYLTNLTPSDFPRRQTTSQLRPVLASREKASRSLPVSTLASSTVILAPEVDKSCATHWRAANPPSRVTHPGWCIDLRASRFLFAATISLPMNNIFGTALAR